MTSGGSGGRLLFRLIHLGPAEPWLRRFSLLAAFGVWPRVVGRRRVPKGPCVVTGTHLSRLDAALFAIATSRHIQWVAADTFLRMPLLGAVVAWGGWHPLQQAGFGLEANAAMMESAAAAARAGAAVGIFTQGFTTTFGSGAARIAGASGAPVLPIFTYRPLTLPMHRQMLVVVHRPLPAPAPDARSRRRFVDRMKRRMRALGAHRDEGDAGLVRDVALDDPALWRSPPAVVRRAGRLARVRDLAPLARRARQLLRACRRMRCSVGDLRDPAGLAHLVTFLLLLPLALAGAVLVSPPVAALYLRYRGRPAEEFRVALLRLAVAFALPWGLVLALAGWLAAGPPGLVAPLVALAGACAAGVARRLSRRLRGSIAVRRHGHRLRPRLAEFDRRVGAAGA